MPDANSDLPFLPALAEEGEMGELAHEISRAMAEAGMAVWLKGPIRLDGGHMNGALLIAAAEAAAIVALASTKPDMAIEAATFIAERTKARVRNAVHYRRKAKERETL